MMSRDTDLKSARESIKGNRDADRRAALLMQFLKNKACSNYKEEFRNLQQSYDNIVNVIKQDCDFLFHYKHLSNQQLEEVTNSPLQRQSQQRIDSTKAKQTGSTASTKSFRTKNSLGLINYFDGAVNKLFEKDRKDTIGEESPMKDHSVITGNNSGTDKEKKLDYRISQFSHDMKKIRSKTSLLMNMNKKAEDYKNCLDTFFDYQYKRPMLATRIRKSEGSFRPPASFRSAKASMIEMKVQKEEMSAPVGSTAVGTERSATIFKTSRSQFGKKTSLPSVERSIFKTKSFARLSIWN